MSSNFGFVASILIAILYLLHETRTFVVSNAGVPLYSTTGGNFINYPILSVSHQPGYCNNVGAMKLSDAGKTEGEWYVVKVTPLPKPLAKEFDLKINFCSTVSFAPEVCQDMYIEISEYEEDHSLLWDSQASNNLTKTNVHITNNVKLIDPSMAVYQGEPAFMEEYFEDGHSRIDSTIPNVVLSRQGEAFAKIGRCPHDKWMIFQTCDTHITWVLVDANIKAAQLPKYEKEYLATLNSLKIDVKTMVDVPVHFDSITIMSPFQRSLYRFHDNVFQFHY